MHRIFDLDPAAYHPHQLHAPDRDWTETNCWLDMMIEVLHTLGHEPLAAGAFTLSSDFDGSQWTLFKFPPEDLRDLFGVEVLEIYVWRPVIDHVEDHLGLGHLVTVEVDAFYLPDTAGVSYGIDHVKTGIVPQLVDREERRLGYFHNAGYFELEGPDFAGIFHLDVPRDPTVLLPYMESVDLDRQRSEPPPVDQVVALTRTHLGRRPTTNPVSRFRKRLEQDLAWLVEAGEAAFHPYSFGTCRQLGANAAIAAAFVDWLDPKIDAGLGPSADRWRALSGSAKALQFSLARAARGRRVDLGPSFESMEADWAGAMDLLVDHLG
ncbi:MAG TPA: DUF1839 family protein [Acidimicrobiales bacterium]|nr:DUF1839 family protein [Acidimicrobiales bacterium]